MEFGPSCTTPKEFWAVTSPCRSCNEPINEIPLVFDTTWIQDFSLHRLAICTATDHATTTLDQSIEEFLRDPLVPLNVVFRLDRETATYGIMQELADMCWYSKRKLKDMYGAVRLDDESHSILSRLTPRVKSRDIGLTEIKACNLEHIYNYLCCFIVHVCSFSIGPNENYDVSMWILTTPPNELPWCGIIKQLYMCNRLPALIRLVQLNTEVPAPSCYTYEGSAAQYVGTSIWGSFAGHIAIPRLTILSYYRTGELASHIEMYVTNLYWKCLMMEVGKFYRFNSMTTNCTILFHTRPDRNILAVYPESVMDENIRTGNSFLTTHIQEGFTDLTDPGTVQRMEEYEHRYCFITSDLDAYDSVIFRSCMQNIISFCLKNGTSNCVYILAISLLDPHGIAICISFLRQCVQHTTIMLPIANCNYRKAYLVCHGEKRPLVTEVSLC